MYFAKVLETKIKLRSALDNLFRAVAGSPVTGRNLVSATCFRVERTFSKVSWRTDPSGRSGTAWISGFGAAADPRFTPAFWVRPPIRNAFIQMVVKVQ